MIDLTDKTALVCAGTRGLGFACASALLSTGANIIINGRFEESLSQAKLRLQQTLQSSVKPPSIGTWRFDLGDIENLNEELRTRKFIKNIDILIINSGGPSPGTFDSFETSEDFDSECMKITSAATQLMKAIVPAMALRGWGRVVNISSIGFVKPIPTLAVSNASRAFLGGLMVGMVSEYASKGITLNNILPGIIWTDRQKRLTEDDAQRLGLSYDDALLNKRNSIPSKFIGDPSDVGALCAFLSSDVAGYVNGQSIAVDGGLLGVLR